MIYDITQELFSGKVFPGDPAPSYERVLSINNGDKCNLTTLNMCAHNATHMDAPSHFVADGKTIDQVELEKCIGPATVVEINGKITPNDIRSLGLKKVTRVLFKGNGILSPEAAQELVNQGIKLVGTEKQTVGSENDSAEVHMILLNNEIVILEGVILREVPEGNYYLFAAPLKLGGLDGSPCRAVLCTCEEV